MTSEEIKLWVSHITTLAKNHKYMINEYIYNNKIKLFQVASGYYWQHTDGLPFEPEVEEMEKYLTTKLSIASVEIDTENKSVSFYNKATYTLEVECDDEDDEDEECDKFYSVYVVFYNKNSDGKFVKKFDRLELCTTDFKEAVNRAEEQLISKDYKRAWVYSEGEILFDRYNFERSKETPIKVEHHRFYQGGDCYVVHDILVRHADLLIRGRKDGRGYVGYVTYDEDKDVYTYISRIGPAAEKFMRRFKNAGKLEGKLYIKSLDFVEWFMNNLDYMYYDGFGSYCFDNDKPIDEDEESEE